MMTIMKVWALCCDDVRGPITQSITTGANLIEMDPMDTIDPTAAFTALRKIDINPYEVYIKHHSDSVTIRYRTFSSSEE
jgi:hypothetical protein